MEANNFSAYDIFQAQYLIFEKMREEGFVAGTEDVRLTIEILVPSAQVGRIIGKGGQNVRELQRVTGSVIKLSEQQATPPQADEETTVHIIGPFFSVQVTTTWLESFFINFFYILLLIINVRYIQISVSAEKNPRYGTPVRSAG